MNVTIIGAGSMGRGIGTRMVAGGHSVTLVDVNPEVARRLAEELNASAAHGATARAGDLAGDALEAPVVVLASWYAANLRIARDLGGRLAWKVVVEISNPLNDTFDGLVTPPGTSAAETIRDVLPAGARLVKAFNTTFARTLVQGSVAGHPLDVFLAGDDAGAKEVVAQLVRDGGLVAVDAGPLHRARQLEGMALLGITLQGPLGTGFMSAWKLVA